MYRRRPSQRNTPSRSLNKSGKLKALELDVVGISEVNGGMNNISDQEYIIINTESTSGVRGTEIVMNKKIVMIKRIVMNHCKYFITINAVIYCIHYTSHDRYKTRSNDIIQV